MYACVSCVSSAFGDEEEEEEEEGEETFDIITLDVAAAVSNKQATTVMYAIPGDKTTFRTFSAEYSTQTTTIITAIYSN